MKVSVVLPVYNAEKYLEHSLNSILQQTMTDFELLCIDDGSNDKSLEILQQYAKQDNRIKIYHQENNGVSIARNVGINHAMGNYVVFLDADDWIEEDYLECLYTIVTEKNVEIAICGHDIVTGQKHIPELIHRQGYLSREDALTLALDHNGYQGYLWNKLFHRSLINDNQIRFEEDIHVLEDLLFTCSCMKQVEQVYYEPVVKYHYNQSAGSTNKFTEKSVSMCEATSKLMELFKDEADSILLVKAKSWYSQSTGAACMHYIHYKKKQKAAFYHTEQKRYLKEYLQVNNGNMKMCLRGLLIAYFPSIATRLKYIK